MQWLLELLGFKTSLKRQKEKLAQLQQKAFEAQRNGNLRLAGKYLTEAEFLETQILEAESNQSFTSK